jgi:hypothetical protein
MKKTLAIVGLAACIVGCSTTGNNTQTEAALVETAASLGTVAALTQYPQYRSEMVTAETVLAAVCSNTNGIPVATVEQLLAQGGVTNQIADIGIVDAIQLVDAYAQSQTTNGLTINQTIQNGACWISAGMAQALYTPASVKAPTVRHWYYLWLN